MGSRALQRSGHRVIAYDARGHGRSAPAPEPRATATSGSPRDLRAVLDAARRRSARCSPARRWARTRRVRFALDAPRARGGAGADHARVRPDAEPRARRRARHAGTRSRAGCARAGWTASSPPMTSPRCPTRWRATVETVLRQRLAAHEHPQAVADALEVVPRSRAVRATSRSCAAIARPDASSSPAATRPTRGTRSRSPSAMRRRSPARSCSSRRRASRRARRSPGRAGSSRALLAELARRGVARPAAYVITYERMPSTRVGRRELRPHLGHDAGARAGGARRGWSSTATRPCSTPAAARGGSPRR